MAARINNQETTIFLGIDASNEASFILLHDVAVVPAPHHQKEPIIHPSHGFSKTATLVTLNCKEIMKLNEIRCASITNACKFVGCDTIASTALVSSQSLLKGRGLVAPPLSSSPS